MKLFKRHRQPGVLSHNELRDYIARGEIVFTPEIDPQQIDQVSIDLRLGPRFTRFRDELPGYMDSIRVDPSLFEAEHLWEHVEAEEYVLQRQWTQSDDSGYKAVQHLYDKPELEVTARGLTEYY